MRERGRRSVHKGLIDKPASTPTAAVSFLATCPVEIWERVFSFVRVAADRNAISQVCKQFYTAEARTRERVLISSCYAVKPDVVAGRFPRARSFCMKGKPRIVDFSLIPHAKKWGAYATPWVKLFAQRYPFLHSLRLKRMSISDSDVETLVRGCGQSLQILELEKCCGFSTSSLQTIARTCRNLRALSFAESEVQQEEGVSSTRGLSMLVDSATSLQFLDMTLVEIQELDIRVLLQLAAHCHTLHICESMKIDQILPFLKACTSNVRSLGMGLHSHNAEHRKRIAVAMSNCKDLTEMSGLWDLDEDSVMMLTPIAPHLTRLDLTYALLGEAQLSDLISSCVNLDDLKVRTKHPFWFFFFFTPFCLLLLLSSSSPFLRTRVGSSTHHLELRTGVFCRQSLTSIVCNYPLYGFSFSFSLLLVTDVIGDEGLRVLGRSCKKLRRLVVLHNEAGFITQHGLVGVAIGCHLLEKLIFYSADMNSEAMGILALSCPGLTDVRLCHVQKYHASHPVVELEGNNTLNEGIRALLQGCRQVRRLALCFCNKFGLSNVVVTEDGIRYVGEYGTNLRMITLTNCGSGNSESLSYIAMGCLQLRKLELLHCMFTDASLMALAQGCPCLKYLWVQDCPVSLVGVKALARRPGLHVEVVRETEMQGMIVPWQMIAYASATSARNDRPEHIDYVDESYNVPVISKEMPHRHNVTIRPSLNTDGNSPDYEDEDSFNLPGYEGDFFTDEDVITPYHGQ